MSSHARTQALMLAPPLPSLFAGPPSELRRGVPRAAAALRAPVLGNLPRWYVPVTHARGVHPAAYALCRQARAQAHWRARSESLSRVPAAASRRFADCSSRHLSIPRTHSTAASVPSLRLQAWRCEQAIAERVQRGLPSTNNALLQCSDQCSERTGADSNTSSSNSNSKPGSASATGERAAGLAAARKPARSSAVRVGRRTCFRCHTLVALILLLLARAAAQQGQQRRPQQMQQQPQQRPTVLIASLVAGVAMLVACYCMWSRE